MTFAGSEKNRVADVVGGNMAELVYDPGGANGIYHRIADESGLRRSDFILSCGYKSIEGGLRKLDEWLEQGFGDEGCLQRIVDAYHPDPTELEAALAETAVIRQRSHREAIQEIEGGERRRFRPFIWVHTVDGAHSFFSAMAERQVRVLLLPEGFEHLPESAKLEAVQRRVREHYQEMGGKYIGFGEILRYRFANTSDASTVLDTQGDVIENQGGRFLLPEVWFELH